MSLSEDIANLKQLKESEPLQNAWDNWIQARQVVALSFPSCTVPEGTLLVALGRNSPAPS